MREKSLGPDHSDTTRSRNNLGVMYHSEGKYEQAEQLLQRALNISEQTLGLEHLDTLNFVLIWRSSMPNRASSSRPSSF